MPMDARQHPAGVRVCIDAHSVNSESGGVHQVVIGLAQGLSTLVDGRDEYLFVVGDDAGWLEPYISGPCRLVVDGAGGHAAHRVRSVGRARPLARRAWEASAPFLGSRTIPFRRESDIVRQLDPDVVHFPIQNAFMTERPNLYHPHDLQYLHFPHFFTRRQRQVGGTYIRTYCSRATMVGVAWNWGRLDLLRAFDLPSEKVRVLPWGPVLDGYPSPTSADVDDVRRRFELPERFAFYPAKTWEHKNHRGLLDAVRILRDERGRDVPLVFSGHHTDRYPRLRRYAASLGLADSISWLGFVTPLELMALYELAHCVVIPTKFEAGSFPLWEAFLMGVPAACSNVTSLPEQADGAVVHFDPDRPASIADALERVWLDDELRSRLAERGEARVKAFGWPQLARNFRAHYRLLAGAHLTTEDVELVSAAASEPGLGETELALVGEAS